MPEWLVFLLGVWTGTFLAVPLIAWFAQGGDRE